jgi:WD40 repeat protein
MSEPGGRPKTPKALHPSKRLADDSIDGIAIRCQQNDQPKYKSVQDKDGKWYAQGTRLQTDKLQLVNRRLQSLDKKEMEIQTIMPGEEQGADQVVDEQQIAEFLRVVAPIMEQELELALGSMPVFDAYEPVWDDMDETCDMVHKVSWTRLRNDADETDGATGRREDSDNGNLNISSVAWNVTGATLACAFGRLDTEGWCEISAPVCLWNLFRPQRQSTEPDVVIQVSNFVMSLAFHPTKPAILAGGTYNGELMIWDTVNNELDPLIASSTIDDYFHREAIQAVQWIQADLTGSAEAWLLATVSGDGKVLIWDPREEEAKLSYPSRGFMLKGSKKRLLGGRSLSFSPLDPLLFVVGCENGTVMRAFRAPPGPSMGQVPGQYPWRASAVALLDQLAANQRLQLQHHVEGYCRTAGKKEVTAEIVFESKPDHNIIFPASSKMTELEPHAGPVTVSAMSPFHRKLLLTASVDGAVKLYDVLQQRALMTFFPPSPEVSTCSVAAAAWSLSRLCVFAVAMEMGGVYIYDLVRSRQEPVMHLPLKDTGSQKVTSLAFNPKQRGLLAVGDESGQVRVYRLPFGLSEQQRNEMQLIGEWMKLAR